MVITSLGCVLIFILIITLAFVVSRKKRKEGFTESSLDDDCPFEKTEGFFGSESNDKIKLPSVDGNTYQVNPNMPCPPCASNMLGKLNLRTQKLIDYLEQKYPDDPRLQRLKERYSPERLYENTPTAKSGETSYTDKKRWMYLCLRDMRKPDKPLHDENFLFFTKCHEMGHTISLSYGHNDEFKKNFLWILNNAVDAGVYRPDDYRHKPVMFCQNLIVARNPLFDRF